MTETGTVSARSLATLVIAATLVRFGLEWHTPSITPGTSAPAGESPVAATPAGDSVSPEMRNALREIDGLIRQKRYARAHARAYALLEQQANQRNGAVLVRAALASFLQGEELRAWYLTTLAMRSGSALEQGLAVTEQQFKQPRDVRDAKVAALDQALQHPAQADLAVLREFRGVPWVDGLYAERQNQTAGAVLADARRVYDAAIAECRERPVIDVAGIELRLVPAGSFLFGDEWGDGEADEQPAAPATIARPFYLGTHEVTQGEWQAVLGANPSRGPHANDLPVNSVTFAAISMFLEKTGLRLPTEAEWEYAVKAGCSLKFAIGNLPQDLDRVAWHAGNGDGHAHAVATRVPNAWGFFDLLGNVHEWCATPYAPTPSLTLAARPSADDARPRAIRGGSWSFDARPIRTTLRNKCDPQSAGGAIGLRVARDVD